MGCKFEFTAGKKRIPVPYIFYLFWSHCGTLHTSPTLMSLTCAATAGMADRGKEDEVNSPTHASADRVG